MGLSSSTPIDFSPTVETKSGPVRGKVFTFDEKKYDAFLGIPYAKPPVGDLRFKKPQPVEEWKDIKDCLEFGPRCPQLDDFFQKRMNIVGMDESQCLTLNVISPREKSDEWKTGYPVMIWIHGGGFAMHSSSNYGDSTIARNLCSKEVIFVSLNYRLGALGFFTTGDDLCKGNLGLWDQTLAVQWVKENIQRFGGDLENITLFGQSAGGASVDILSISPHSRDLFRRVIPMGGTSDCPFALRTNRDQASISRQFARFLGWQGANNDTEGLLAFMSEQPAEKLTTAISKNFTFEESGSIAFTPNIDGDFLPKSIAELRKESPKREIMAGTTDNEGLVLVFLKGFPFTEQGIHSYVEKMIKEVDFGENTEQVKREIIDVYTKGAKAKSDFAKKMSDLVGDYLICIGHVRHAESMAALNDDVYFYCFPYYNPGGFGVFRWIFPFRAATHAMEIRYILGKGILSKFQPNADDLKMLDKMTTYFTNFAKYGNPNGKEIDGPWKKHSADEPLKHFKIELEKTEMSNYYLENRSEFWFSRVMPKYRSWVEVNGAVASNQLEK